MRLLQAQQMGQQLRQQGYCSIPTGSCQDQQDQLTDVMAVLESFFSSATPEAKAAASSTPAAVAAGQGRGFVRLPAKEVLEVGPGWRPAAARPDVRLAAASAFQVLADAAKSTLEALLAARNGSLEASQRQLLELLQPPGTPAAQDSGCGSSLLHVSWYPPQQGSSAGQDAAAPAAAAAAAAAPAVDDSCELQGVEAHVDKGLLTLVVDNRPGLQVLARDGSWQPVGWQSQQFVVLVGHSLSFLTAADLPAAVHRVALDSSSSSSGGGGGRLSLAFKLRPAASSVLCPAAATGIHAGQLPPRYRSIKSWRQLMAEFEASHLSIHQAGPQQLPSLSSAAGTAGGGSLVRLERELDASPARPRADARPGQPEFIMIVRDPLGLTIHFKVRPSTWLECIADAYAEALGRDPFDVRFVSGTRGLSRQSTVGEAGICEGDVIDAVLARPWY